MKNSNMPASPAYGDFGNNGLTKREHFAALAMQGFLASGKVFHSGSTLASSSLSCADHVLEELERKVNG